MASVVNYLFAVIGYSIGTRPITFILISFLIFAISLLGPIFRLDVRMDLKSGFTRRDAPSVTEVGAHINFFGSMGDPWYLALFAVARNTTKGNSLLNETEKSELSSFFQKISREMVLEDDAGKFKYRDDLCKPFCTFNSGLWKMLEYQSYYTLTYPLATVGPYKANIGKFIFERTLDKNGIVRGSRTIAVYFTTFVNETRKEKRLQMFEHEAFKRVQDHNANPNNTITFVLHGAHAVSKEVQRGVRMAAPYFISGALLLILFVIFSFVFASVLYNQFYWGKMLLVVAAIGSPLLAAFTAIGFVLLFGFHINMLVLISPFLTLAIGIGVDDAFLISNTWMIQKAASLAQSHTPPERLQLVLEKVGVAMAVTSLTNVLGFALGCLAPVPEIRLFCATVSLSMFFDLVFQLLLYAPLVVLIANHEPSETRYKISVEKPTRNSLQSLRASFRTFVAKYCKFLASLWAELLVAGILVGYLILSIKGIHSLKTQMDGKMLLPPDSQSNEGIRIISEVVWPDFLGINYIVRKPPNFADPKEYRKFSRMLKAIEKTDYAIGPDANMVWIYDYMRYLADPSASMLDVFFGTEPAVINETIAEINGLDMSKFQKFIKTEPYDAWQSGVHYKLGPKNETIITEMLLMIGYKKTGSLADKARLLPICRAAARRFPEYDIVPFDTDSQMVDVILDVPHTTKNTMFFTVVAMGAVFFLLSCNFATSLVATLSVASICTGVLGMLHFWGCYLDPLTMVAVIMTAGLGVDFTVHIAFHYLMNEKNDEDTAKRINTAFTSCGLSMIQAGVSTLLVMLPVLLCPIGIYTVIAKAIVLVVLIGLLHGLFIVPVVLAAIPNCLTGANCCVSKST